MVLNHGILSSERPDIEKKSQKNSTGTSPLNLLSSRASATCFKIQNRNNNFITTYILQKSLFKQEMNKEIMQN